MILEYEITQVYIGILIFIFGWFVCFIFSKYYGIHSFASFILYCWHTVGCIGYYIYSLTNNSDSFAYYKASLEEPTFGVGTRFVNYLTSLFSTHLDLSYFSIFLVFNTIGAIGLISYFLSLSKVVGTKSYKVKFLAYLLILLPSLSFWSSAIGKDSISFLAVCLATQASFNLKKHMTLLIISVTCLSMVRPHIAVILVLSLGISIMFGDQIQRKGKLIISIGIMIIATVVVPFVMSYVGLASFNGLYEYIKIRQAYNAHGGSSIELPSMNILHTLFSYGFRPLPYEAHNTAALLASIDNLFCLLIFLFGIYSYLKYKHSFDKTQIIFLGAYTITTWTLLALVTANLGIAVRQKWMFMPMVLLLCFEVIQKGLIGFGSSYRKLEKNN